MRWRPRPAEGGQILPAGTVKVAEGASVTFTALPDAGFALDAMLVDGAPVEAPGGVCTIADVRGDRTGEGALPRRRARSRPAACGFRRGGGRQRSGCP